MDQQVIYDFLGELQMENYRARDEDVNVWILQQLLEGPRDEANLKDCLSDDLHPSSPLPEPCAADDLHPSSPLPDPCADDLHPYSPLRPDANTHSQTTEPRITGRRGTRKRRTTSWNPMFFGRHNVSRKNNSRWTAKEVERLVQGVSKFGAGRWTKIEQNFFRSSIRTAVNLKDKWRNLKKAYKENSHQTTLLYLEPSLVERIKKLAAKQSYANKRNR